MGNDMKVTKTKKPKWRHDDDVTRLASALSKIAGDLIQIGLGEIVLGDLAAHMLKLRPSR